LNGSDEQIGGEQIESHSPSDFLLIIGHLINSEGLSFHIIKGATPVLKLDYLGLKEQRILNS
jgi:hypothetical protein